MIMEEILVPNVRQVEAVEISYLGWDLGHGGQ